MLPIQSERTLLCLVVVGSLLKPILDVAVVKDWHLNVVLTMKSHFGVDLTWKMKVKATDRAKTDKLTTEE